MDRLTKYRQLIKRILGAYVDLVNQHSRAEVASQLVVDEERDHYLWLRYGWSHGKHTQAVVVYVRLREGKFWIEEDWTEAGIATELVQAGVPPHDIVLAFQPPETRTHTEFAAA